MSKFVMAGVLASILCGAATAGEVIVPNDTTPFKVTEGDTVRIVADGIAGTQVKVKVTGPAKEEVRRVVPYSKGKPLIGPGNHEVDVKPTGKGKVTVEVTITPPNGPAKTEKYEFEVEAKDAK
ncbi:Uncharacterized protein OS=Blastopirellula marina DSM 3645 GN=DSM3645_18061 PE=4 SV=1 [Gemmataceae bacterium]|nr:Uncharacterized protein OS=Blastopirellula marina DSM 3645 GN=DSM3645_18061 PE=4 SV=1 [Gemmataceae bacterium]VTT97939.1 Uncharacterized protein OS=Blastopirellula marina DSM 3645 GN=DSM3645_18061 PE=4 SV=1 [Gemmataceae bacterium]